MEIQPNKLLCHCMKVTNKTVLNCINEGCSSLKAVVEHTTAGSACTACHFKIISLIEETNENRNSETKSCKERE